MTNISKALNRKIRMEIGYCPAINDYRMTIYEKIVFDHTPEQLVYIADLISSGKFQSFFIDMSEYGDAFFILEKLESDAEYLERCNRERAAVEKWYNDKDKIVKEYQENQQMEKLKKNEKFSDPEYIEYLRMKRKFEKEE